MNRSVVIPHTVLKTLEFALFKIYNSHFKGLLTTAVLSKSVTFKATVL